MPTTHSFPFSPLHRIEDRIRTWWHRNAQYRDVLSLCVVAFVMLALGGSIAYFRMQQINDARHWNSASRVWNWEELPSDLTVAVINNPVGPDKVLLGDNTGDRLFLVRLPAGLDIAGKDTCSIAERRCF